MKVYVVAFPHLFLAKGAKKNGPMLIGPGERIK